VFTTCYWDYGPFLGTFVKKSFFHKEGLSNEILQLVNYFIYSCHSMSHIFFKSNLSRDEFLRVHKLYQILCFIFKNEHNFKLYHNMFKCSSFSFCVINYNFPLNNIYIASHLHVVKDSCFKQTLIFYKHKIEKNMKIWVFFMCLIVSYYYKKIEHQNNCVIKTKVPFMKVTPLNETIKHPLFQPKANSGRFFNILDFSISILVSKHYFP